MTGMARPGRPKRACILAGVGKKRKPKRVPVDDGSSPVLRSRPLGKSPTLLHSPRKADLAFVWWNDHLRSTDQHHPGWIRFTPSQKHCHNAGFVPIQYLLEQFHDPSAGEALGSVVLKRRVVKSVLKHGERGLHYALGWLELYYLLRRFGEFRPDHHVRRPGWDGHEVLVRYKGPSLLLPPSTTPDPNPPSSSPRLAPTKQETHESPAPVGGAPREKAPVPQSGERTSPTVPVQTPVRLESTIGTDDDATASPEPSTDCDTSTEAWTAVDKKMKKKKKARQRTVGIVIETLGRISAPPKSLEPNHTGNSTSTKPSETTSRHAKPTAQPSSISATTERAKSPVAALAERSEDPSEQKRALREHREFCRREEIRCNKQFLIGWWESRKENFPGLYQQRFPHGHEAELGRIEDHEWQLTNGGWV